MLNPTKKAERRAAYEAKVAEITKNTSNNAQPSGTVSTNVAEDDLADFQSDDSYSDQAVTPVRICIKLLPYNAISRLLLKFSISSSSRLAVYDKHVYTLQTL